jgi:hypothetical protein
MLHFEKREKFRIATEDSGPENILAWVCLKKNYFFGSLPGKNRCDPADP